MVGVFSKQWVQPLAQVLKNLGAESVWVVHGSDGLDEVVSGTVLSAADGQPVPYGTISVGDTAEGRFADAAGRFALGGPPTGTYHLRAQQVGFLPLDTTLSAGDGSQHLVLRLQPLPVRLANLPAESPQHGCAAPQLAESGAPPAVAMVLAQLRQNAERYRILHQYPFNYRLEESRAIQLAVHTRDEQDSVIALDTAMYDSRHGFQHTAVMCCRLLRLGVKPVRKVGLAHAFPSFRRRRALGEPGVAPACGQALLRHSPLFRE